MKKIVTILLTVGVFVLFCVWSRPSWAQEEVEQEVKPTVSAVLSYPIPELGNCASRIECRAYCQETENRDTCIAYAKQRGFYREPDRAAKIKLVEYAQQQLGCTSREQCHTFCQMEENKDKCREFLQKNGLERNAPKTSDGTVLRKAQELLGCDSAESCREFCQNDENRERCINFARQTGLKSSQLRNSADRGMRETEKASSPANMNRLPRVGERDAEKEEMRERPETEKDRMMEKKPIERKELQESNDRPTNDGRPLEKNDFLMEDPAVKGAATVYSWWQRFVDYVVNQ